MVRDRRKAGELKSASRVLWWTLLTVVGPLIAGVLIERLASQTDPWLLVLHGQLLVHVVLMTCILASRPPQQLTQASIQEGFAIDKTVRQSLQNGCNYALSVRGGTLTELTLVCNNQTAVIVRRDWKGQKPGRYVVYTLIDGTIAKSVVTNRHAAKSFVPRWHPEFVEPAPRWTPSPFTLCETTELLQVLDASPRLVTA